MWYLLEIISKFSDSGDSHSGSLIIRISEKMEQYKRVKNLPHKLSYPQNLAYIMRVIDDNQSLEFEYIKTAIWLPHKLSYPQTLAYIKKVIHDNQILEFEYIKMAMRFLNVNLPEGTTRYGWKCYILNVVLFCNPQTIPVNKFGENKYKIQDRVMNK